MVTFNELCNASAELGKTSGPLHEACALPRSPADMCPLPKPHAEVAFDSSWDALLTGSDGGAQPED